ncbi:hypothetical protein DB346_12005 [Verrucomicrobia bacterium LW23]|nr:hypothetical protein DB346_12005 [Verrucomicrobia bacterium LW23]
MYQRERFPVLAHGPLVLAFSACAVCFSALLRGVGGETGAPGPDVATIAPPTWHAFLVAFVTSFISFLHLRIADEFKDLEEDTLYRPYRPVPRGLVTLRELAVLGIAGAVIQLALALWLDARLLVPLLATWAYLALMSREFFCRDWLKARPITYMWTHMLIMPLIDFYATACDWLPTRDAVPPPGLAWFVAVSFFSGFIIEIGRKIRSPLDEEAGVPTYSATWGRGRAVTTLAVVIGLTSLSAILAAACIRFAQPVAVVIVAMLLVYAAISARFLGNPSPGRGKSFELFAALWTLALYLGLGVAPFALRVLWASPAT